MPRKPKHPCSYPGCPKLTDKRFCEEHEKLSNSNYEKYGRDKSTKKRYGRAWKRIRDKYAAEHPLPRSTGSLGMPSRKQRKSIRSWTRRRGVRNRILDIRYSMRMVRWCMSRRKQSLR